MFFLFHIFSMPSYLNHCRGSKLALLHRVKERKTPSLSAQASFAPFSLQVAWSRKFLIEYSLYLPILNCWTRAVKFLAVCRVLMANSGSSVSAKS